LPNWDISLGFLYVYLIYRLQLRWQGTLYFFSLAGPVGDYTGAHTVIFAGFFYKSPSGKIYAPGSPSSGLKRSILFRGAFSVYHSVLRIQDILVWIRIQLWIRGSMPLPIVFGFGSGCGSGSCYFRQ
jgi:hypothetical protein